MSRKGNYYDNCIMETFFGRLKNEMFYGLEKDYPRRRRQPDSLECLSEGFLLFLRHIGQNIPHEMHLAALPRGAGKGLTDCRNQPGVSIGNDKLGREQTMVLQILKQHSIGALGFFGHRFNSDDISMSIFVHTAHDKYRHADNSSIYSNFFVQCIHPENRVYCISKGAITELLDLLIQVSRRQGR